MNIVALCEDIRLSLQRKTKSAKWNVIARRYFSYKLDDTYSKNEFSIEYEIPYDSNDNIFHVLVFCKEGTRENFKPIINKYIWGRRKSQASLTKALFLALLFGFMVSLGMKCRKVTEN